MKKVFALSMCLAPLLVIAQEPSVPVTVADGGPVFNLALLDSGARWRTFLPKQSGAYWGGRAENAVDALYAELERSAIISENGSDVSSVGFCGRHIFKHMCNLIVWDGVFEAKKSGTYAVYAESRSNCDLYVNGEKVQDFGSSPKEVTFRQGANYIVLVNRAPSADIKLMYRLSSSTQQARPLTPSMLKHNAGDILEEVDW